MQIVGVGFSQPYWKQFIQELRTHLPSAHLVGTLLSKQDIDPHEIISSCTRLAELAPDLLLLTPQSFNNSADLFFFLSQTRLRCGNSVRCALLVENFQAEMQLLLEGDPIVQLSNGMRFSLSHESLLIDYELRSFPRVSVESELKGVTYQNSSGEIVWHSLDFFPLHALIPFQQIQHLETQTEVLLPQIWLQDFLSRSAPDLKAEQVRGILKEEHGCVLFPGISLNALEQVSLGEIELHFVLDANQLSLQSAAFKRLLAYLRQHLISEQTPDSISKVYCVGSLPVVNRMMQLIFENQGYKNLEFISEFNEKIQLLEPQCTWLLLGEPSQKNESHLFQMDWRTDIQNILKPLRFFVDWKQLDGDLPQSRRLISLVDLERQRDVLSQKQKQLELEAQLARNKFLFFDQEVWMLQKADAARKLLIPCLKETLDWQRALSHPHQITASQVLLLCEEEEDASELNACLYAIPKRLWMNPFKINSPSDLANTDVNLFQKYQEQGMIILAPTVHQHLMQVCEETQKRFQQVNVMLEQQQQIIQQTTAELEELQQQKQQMALYWLYISLKQLVIRNKKAFSSS